MRLQIPGAGSARKRLLPCFIPQQVTNGLNDGESSQKAVPLSPNNKWEAITVFAAAVLILIAAATVVWLGLLFMRP